MQLRVPVAALVALVLPALARAGEADCCGRHAVRIAAGLLGADPADPWEQRLPTAGAPFSLADLQRAAEAAGLESVAVRWDDPRAADLGGVCILHVRRTDDAPAPNHFVACLGRDRSAVLIADYPNPPAWVPLERVERYWPGTALHLGRPGDPGLARLRRQTLFAAARVPVAVALAVVAGGAGLWLAARMYSCRRRPSAGPPPGAVDA